MQDEKNGIPIRTVKSFLTKIPSVFSGKMPLSEFFALFYLLILKKKTKQSNKDLRFISCSSLNFLVVHFFDDDKYDKCVMDATAGLKERVSGIKNEIY